MMIALNIDSDQLGGEISLVQVELSQLGPFRVEKESGLLGYIEIESSSALVDVEEAQQVVVQQLLLEVDYVLGRAAVFVAVT